MRVFKDVSLCTLNILKVMYADFRYAWGDKQTRFCKCLQAIEIMIHNVDMPLLFWWGGKEHGLLQMA